jgi:REP element-mobilizing transposase RayT
MPRRPRDVSPGLHHVTIGATGYELYFSDLNDRMLWLRRLALVLDRYRWTCVLMCQMTTHAHLIVDVPGDSLPRGMHALNSVYSRDFNAEHGRRGCLLRARYWSKPIRSDAQLVTTYRYGARNPVRAGECERCEHWRYSSVATTCGLTNDYPFVNASRVLSQFGRPPEASRRLLAYLAAGD